MTLLQKVNIFTQNDHFWWNGNILICVIPIHKRKKQAVHTVSIDMFPVAIDLISATLYCLYIEY